MIMRWTFLVMFLMVSCTCSNMKDIVNKPQGNPTVGLLQACQKTCEGKGVRALNPECLCKTEEKK